MRVLASGDDEGLHYMVMEFVDGLVLRDILRTHDRLTTEEALAVALDVVSALDEAHQRGVIHRDVKPHNIFVTRAGVKLGDFGIARADDLTAVTVHAGYLGTIAYGSPEQVRGEEPDARSDIYALGVVMYEMLSGQAPTGLRVRTST